jgi:ribosomal protein S18 acetylase RimI-like enzyme
VIRTAVGGDRQSVFDIWKTCFGDGDAYINFFLDKLFVPQHCLLYTLDGEAAAMLHLLPMIYNGGDKQADAQYIYAAATMPEYRRRGIMGELIDFAATLGADNGRVFTVLMPANEGLYEYYQKCGFSTAFYVKRAQMGRGELEKLAAGAPPLKDIQFDAGLIFRQRAIYFKPAVLWGFEMFEYIADEWRFSGGKIFAWAGGFSFLKRTSDALFIKEACMRDGELPAFAAALLKLYDGQKFVFQLQERSPLFIGDGFMRYGMIRHSNNEQVQEFCPGTYFNMVLD